MAFEKMRCPHCFVLDGHSSECPGDTTAARTMTDDNATPPASDHLAVEPIGRIFAEDDHRFPGLTRIYTEARGRSEVPLAVIDHSRDGHPGWRALSATFAADLVRLWNRELASKNATPLDLDKIHARTMQGARDPRDIFDLIEAQRAALARIRTLEAALSDLADLYDTDEGCRSLPQYNAALAALSTTDAQPQADSARLIAAEVDRSETLCRALWAFRTAKARIASSDYEVEQEDRVALEHADALAQEALVAAHFAPAPQPDPRDERIKELTDIARGAHEFVRRACGNNAKARNIRDRIDALGKVGAP